MSAMTSDYNFLQFHTHRVTIVTTHPVSSLAAVWPRRVLRVRRSFALTISFSKSFTPRVPRHFLVVWALLTLVSMFSLAPQRIHLEHWKQHSHGDEEHDSTHDKNHQGLEQGSQSRQLSRDLRLVAGRYAIQHRAQVPCPFTARDHVYPKNVCSHSFGKTICKWWSVPLKIFWAFRSQVHLQLI